jgi:hypothetical protein
MQLLRIVLVGLLPTLFTPFVSWSQTPFNTAHEISLSRFGSYRAVWPADADGDPFEDLLALSSEKLVWFHNEGGSTYGAPVIEQNVTKGATSALRVDVDGDGLMDIVAICTADSTISWFRNVGATGFAPIQTLLQLGAVPFTFAMQRIDGDDDLDIALGFAQLSGSEVQWWSNDGAQFTGPLHIYNLNPPYSVKGFLLSDLDLDGDADAVVSLLDHVGVCLANGTGSFAPLALLTDDLDDVIRSTTIADADQDGDMDLLVCTQSQLRCFLNMGSPTYPEATPLLSGLADLRSVVVLDPVSNGAQELIVQDMPYARIHTLASGPSLIAISTHRMAGIAHISTHDHDADGDEDLLFADGSLGHLVQEPGGAFHVWPDYAHRTAFWPLDVATGDLDADGAPDVIVSGLTTVSIFLNDGTTNFRVGPPDVTVQSGPVAAVAVDIDEDGFDEIFVGMECLNGAQGGIARISHALGPVVELDTILVAETGIFHVGRADVDGNGRDDVLFTHPWVDQVGLFYTVGPGVQNLVLTGSPNADTPNAVLAADLDGDGYLDLVRDATSTVSDIQWHRNNTIGGFPGALPLGHVLPSTDELVGGFAVGDLNNDAYTDVVASIDDGTEQLAIYFNNWDGTVWTQAILEPTMYADDILVGDLDSDGHKDIVALAEDTPAPWVWMANGNGTFAPGVELSSMISRVYSIVLDDLDGDGDLDLLASGMDTAGVSLFATGVYWYENDGDMITALGRQQEKIGDFAIWPNPTSESFHAEGFGLLNVFDRVEVRSTDGRLVAQSSHHAGRMFVFDVSNLADGIYVVHLSMRGVAVHDQLLVLARGR